MCLLIRLFIIISALFWATPLLAQSSNPTVEVVLSTDQAQKGDTIYADVIIRNGHAIGGADVGITVGDCLRVIERLPGNYLPSTSEEGGFSPFSELTENSTRLAASVTSRARIASGDGTFYRVAMEVTCEQATPEVKVTFAEFAALAKPDTDSTELVDFSLENGKLSVVSDTVSIQPGAVVATAAPIQAVVPLTTETAPAINQNTILIAALGVMGLAVVGLVVLLIVYGRNRGSRKQS